MKFSEFEAKVSATLADYMKKLDLNGQYMHLALGIHEESGEVTTLIRKTAKGNYHEKQLDVVHLKEEIGDVLWYIAQISSKLPETTLKEIVENNHKKRLDEEKIFYEEIDNISNYEKSIELTYPKGLPHEQNERGKYFSLGLIKAVGEVSSLFGESILGNTQINIPKMKEKMGDTLEYLTAIANTYNLSLERISEQELKKCSERYDHNGIAKKDENEK